MLVRLFWILSCTLAAIYMVFWCQTSWHRFKYKPIGVVQETSYLHWNSSFPAISVCESDADLGAVAELADKLFGKEHDLDLETFLRDIVYFEGNCYSCQNLCGKTLNCSEEFDYLLNQLLRNCTWNGEPIECCNAFRSLATEVGPCFTMNSIHTERRELRKIGLSKVTGPGTLNFQTVKDVVVYIHSEEDVPFFNHPLQEKELVILGTKIYLTFQMAEVNNDPALQHIPTSIRKCKFPKEGGLTLYDYYSYSGCVVECRTAAQLSLCNCVHHFLPKTKNGTRNTCGISGLQCLSGHSRLLRTLKTPASSIEGLACNCPSSCNELDLIVVSKSAKGIFKRNPTDFSDITIKMESLPKSRFKRFVSLTNLEFAVYLGGILGLNFGASLLSIVEIPYFMFLRRMGD